MEIFTLDKNVKSHTQASTWPYDKYPDMPVLTAHNKVVFLDADGPGIVSNIHVSDYIIMGADPSDEDKKYSAQLIIRIYYDNEQTPTIEMPLMDFLGDVDATSAYYTTKYFSRVMESHNFRVPIPFKKHIKIEVENPTDTDLMGYADIQYETVKKLPKNTGRLCVDFREIHMIIPTQTATLFEQNQGGVIAAHWFKIEGQHPNFAEGEGLCEANVEFYLDGDTTPTVQYLGNEDLYGFSWGFKSLQSEYLCAIIHKEHLNPGARIGILRCREDDAIRYAKSCKVVMDYTQDYFSAQSKNPLLTTMEVFKHRERYEAPVSLKSCYYYYK